MTFRQFAFNNIMRSKRTYAAHFLSSTFSVMVFFTYALLLFHPGLQGELASTSATMSKLGTMGMQISQYLIFIFSFFFLLYSVSSFLKTRKKEFGILMMHGMSPSQLNKLIFIENMLMGIASVVSGILVGLIFSKLMLLLSANILAIDNGLPFYVPFKAVFMTAGSFLILFLIISLFTSKMVKVNNLIDLMRSEEKPKPEPKASKGFALLSLVLIGLGYAFVFYFVIERDFIMPYLVAGVACVVVGTYFLFSQLSVYVIRMLKKNEIVFFNKTNLLTISELAYRMKDNATMFFMLAIVSAVAFTGIGTCLAMGNKGLTEMTNPFAFTYTSFGENKQEEEHIAEIKKQLTASKLSYQVEVISPKFTENNYTLIKLTEYNRFAKFFGREAEKLDNDQEIMLVPTSVSQKEKYERGKGIPPQLDLVQGNSEMTFKVKKAIPHLTLPIQDSATIVVSDSLYDKIPNINTEDGSVVKKRYGFVVDNWEKTKIITKKLEAEIGNTKMIDSDHYFEALYSKWISSKQQNGILLIVSVLVGIVFFTFAASLLYFRLYADLEREQKQYEMIAKVGLSRKELKKIVTRQLMLMFYLPITLAVIHSGVAFMALQQLVDFSVLKTSIIIFLAFLSIQSVYFYTVRWRYLQKLYKKVM
ncbi:FtsX-like permease family protein [Bacillus thuringiensis]|uniref:FtsX-like permease family protein n=1 Tax=Bacillus thuringiensis TaxID=1428 RepID=UPI000BEC1B09|nr:ABC transporter permease [Bacillus thuringiensis]MEC2260603.1 ABC transporter permease [Bacillus cereus]PEB73349.1 ABC transporter permease [Bacillus thuringiensis]PFB85809.1 ABC transporter permease [Bacillus thuringiensis]PGL73972.1 ABC transporter permease [Bacillus thuringiensis]PGN37132.1 ABC transporter permease [Bacillus thuringiensis]